MSDLKESHMRTTTLMLEPEVVYLTKEVALSLINDLAQDLAGKGIKKETFHLHGHTIIFQVKE